MKNEIEKLSGEIIPESHRDKNCWHAIKTTIERFNEEHIASAPSVRLCEDEDIFRWEDGDSDINPENGLTNSFEQRGGIKVVMRRTVGEEGLNILADAIFSDNNGTERLRLSSVLPKGYIVLEEAKPNHDFMLAGDAAVIVMAPDFLCSTEGRMRFLHEVGHAFDYEEYPRIRGELLDNLKGFTIKKREINAWKRAKDVLKKISDNGVDFLPKGFEETIMWENFEKDAIEEHDYKEEK